MFYFMSVVLAAMAPMLFSSVSSTVNNVEMEYAAEPTLSATESEHGVAEQDLDIDDLDLGVNEPMLSVNEIAELIKGKGRLITPGMNPSDYIATLREPWKEIAFSEDAEILSSVSFSFDKVFEYSQWESLLFDLAKHEDVRLYEIGETMQGRKIYSVEVGSAEKTVLLSAGVHAREIGGVYLLYQMLKEKVEEAEKDDAARQSLMDSVKFAAVVLANPDGYAYYAATGSPIKSNNQYGAGNGIDINRSFPVSYGGILLGVAKSGGDFPNGPAAANYSGPTLGCAKETQALMRFYSKYIAVENSAVAYIDIHQQGRVVYRSTRIDGVDDTGPNHQFGQRLVDYLGYRFAPYEAFNGGEGGTTARMVMDLSLGFKMGRFGVLGLPVEGEALPLALYKDMPNYLDYYPNNASIPSITLEITKTDYSKGPLRNVRDAKAEYSKYKYSGFLALAANEAAIMENHSGDAEAN
ncbi:MAG: hypothetical protein LBU32_29740 [Clostridiales bacterium]|jgi:hypothetical protein|nr:hypothetical protein [Clostridiales bacterium]